MGPLKIGATFGSLGGGISEASRLTLEALELVSEASGETSSAIGVTLVASTS